MHKFDILPHTGDVKIRVVSTTKAGFVSAALEGMFAAAGPRYKEADEAKRQMMPESERHFSVEGADFGQVLVNLLNEAIYQAAANKEAYIGVRLSLVTDKKMEGDLLGKPVDGFTTEIKAATHHDLKVGKNILGYWEATLTFDV